MAIHPDLKSLLRESVREYLDVAEYCVAYRKESSWGEAQVGGCLGCPAGVMLFSIVDTIGFFHRGRTDLRIEVDGKPVAIQRNGLHHFFILNSEYYGQGLDGRSLRKLYDNFRSPLVHNASLAPGHGLMNNPSISMPFPVIGLSQYVNLQPFLEASRGAVQLFLDRLDYLVPGSDQAKNISLKK